MSSLDPSYPKSPKPKQHRSKRCTGCNLPVSKPHAEGCARPKTKKRRGGRRV
jgi:hypothetical protein